MHQFDSVPLRAQRGLAEQTSGHGRYDLTRLFSCTEKPHAAQNPDYTALGTAFGFELSVFNTYIAS